MIKTAAFILVGLFGLVGEPAMAQDGISWPELSTQAFVKDRKATREDIAAGRAVFTIEPNGLGPIALQIPQYVMWTDEQKVAHPMILVQAERAPDGTEIVGLRDFSGAESAATLAEVKLLGTKKPE